MNERTGHSKAGVGSCLLMLVPLVLLLVFFRAVRMFGETGDFNVGYVEHHMAITLRNLRRYFDQFGQRMILLNYDDPDHDIYTAFSASVGIDISKMQALEKRVNRMKAVAKKRRSADPYENTA